jgi:hypothetical protein
MPKPRQCSWNASDAVTAWTVSDPSPYVTSLYKLSLSWTPIPNLCQLSGIIPAPEWRTALCIKTLTSLSQINSINR